MTDLIGPFEQAVLLETDPERPYISEMGRDPTRP